MSEKPKSEHHAAFLRWWEARQRGPQRNELDKLAAMARLMGFAFKGWCELAFYAGRDSNR